MKQCKLFIAILLVLLCLPVLAFAATEFTVETGEGYFTYDLTTEKDDFVVLVYKGKTESGRITLYSPDMKFSGRVELAHSPEGGELVVSVEDTKQTRLARRTVKLPAVAGYKKPEGNGNGKVQNLVLTETADGFHYSFTCAGADYMKLYYSTKQQSATMVIYPVNDEGLFEGDVVSPLTYARTQFTVKVQNKTGGTKKEAKVRKGFVMAPAVEQQEGRLSGVVVCIDPGHQEKGKVMTEPKGPGLKGEVTGTLGMAQGKVTLRREYIVTLEASMRLRDELLRQGATVVLTHDSHDTYTSNQERCDIAEAAGAHIMLRLHCNSASAKPKAQGIFIYGPKNSDYAKAVADQDTYKQMGTLLMNAMKDAVGYERKETNGKALLSDRYIGNNWAKMTCFLVEMGYMTNVEEDIKLATPEYQQLLAEGMAQGVYEIAVMQGWVEAAE